MSTVHSPRKTRSQAAMGAAESTPVMTEAETLRSILQELGRLRRTEDRTGANPDRDATFRTGVKPVAQILFLLSEVMGRAPRYKMYCSSLRMQI
jgi:hypothetical protein